MTRSPLLMLATSLAISLNIVEAFNHPFNHPQQFAGRGQSTYLHSTLEKVVEPNSKPDLNPKSGDKPRVVLVAGFESFNRKLYDQAAKDLNVDLQVFADSDIRVGTSVNDENLGVNPAFEQAVKNADAFIGSLIFDYDDVQVVEKLLEQVKGPRLIFESATELMSFNKVGSFSMESTGDGPAGPPPAVKAILSKFSSGKEEDKISGYLKLLKIGPTLLKYVPGEKAGDLRMWLEAYRFWNQGGKGNFKSMLRLVAHRCRNTGESIDLPELEVTPDIGLIHPLKNRAGGPFFESPATYLNWRLSRSTKDMAAKQKIKLAPDYAPRAAVLLYRKHVITEQRYISDLITSMEAQGIIPIPIFINGVEAHTIVRDLLTSDHELQGIRKGKIFRDSTYQSEKAVKVEAIINTVGFPLVGGPAGSIEAGRNVEVAATLLTNMNVPYIVASPLLLQSIPQWKTNGVLGLQSVVLYSLPELDGAIDTVVLGGLVGDKIALVPERVRKLTSRVKSWIELRRTPPKDRKIAISVYGFPPNVGAVGTAALLDVPKSLEDLLKRLHQQGYDVGDFATDPDASGESLVAALSTLCENPVITAGAGRMQDAVMAKIKRAQEGDETVAATLSKPAGGLGGAKVLAKDISMDDLEKTLGKYMFKKVRRAWGEKERGPGVSSKGELVVSGLQLGNVWITVQPVLGVEGDPMRLLFERDLTPHPQYCASYEYMRLPEAQGGIGAQAVIHMGMHGTVEWLPGMPLGNDRQSWSDELLGNLPNIYVYAANNPSESILAKRRGYGTIVSYNVPPYGRAGLYLELANLKELVAEYRSDAATDRDDNADLRSVIWSKVQKSGMFNDVPLLVDPSDPSTAVTGVDLPSKIDDKVFKSWVVSLADYLIILQERLFSSGLHVLGSAPTDEALLSYLDAYFGDKLSEEDAREVVSQWRKQEEKPKRQDRGDFLNFLQTVFGRKQAVDSEAKGHSVAQDASHIVSLLSRTTEEMDSIVNALDGGFVQAGPGGDLLRDGPSVLPTGRNIHALDPYRMPSAGAWARGQRIASELIKQHQDANSGQYPETIAVTLWGLDAIKTRGESVAIALALAGAKPVKEGTGRIVRFDLVPLEELGRPRIDILASLSGIFR
jgi:magnesium chelatase subunit H